MSLFKKDGREQSGEAGSLAQRGKIKKAFTHVVGSFAKKANYREVEVADREDAGIPAQEDTIVQEDLLKLKANDMSDSSLGSMSLSQVSCYSNVGEDITEIIKGVDLAELLGNAESQAIPPPSTETATTVSSESSLGKRKARDVSDLLEPPTFSRPRVSEVPKEDPFFIARNHSILGLFNSLDLSTGVKWEIARYVSREGELSGMDVTLLQSLTGSNAKSAPKTIKKLVGKPDSEDVSQVIYAKELFAKSPWEELDKEEAALKIDPYAGLGLSDSRPDYYGGKVVFSARLKNNGSNAAPAYQIILEPPELGPSCRFLRRFGSWNFLKIKISKQTLNNRSNGLLDFFKRPFVINGKVYRSYYAKDSNVFLFRTNEYIGPHETILTSKTNDCGPMSLLDFLDWHNPLAADPKQAMAKWATRFALGLSTSVPGLRLNPKYILHEPDIRSIEDSDMTDGCGFINRAALIALRNKFDWHTFPTAVQCRIGGSKGMLCLHPDMSKNTSEEYIACTRPSQIKIRYPTTSFNDPAMCIIDVLQSSHMRVPARLSAETIINLAENGVPHSAFARLFRDGLEGEVTAFTKWDGPDAMFDLWCHVARVGGVMPARAAREAAAEAKAKGHRTRDPEEADDEDDFSSSDLTHSRSTAWWADEVSGLPSSLEETCMVLLDSGHQPIDCAVLREKLAAVARKCVETYTSRFKIDVPMSCSALLIPDPFHCLGEDEIQVKSSHREYPTPDGMHTDIILGDVLLTRNPCKLPTDTRKVKAVYKPELANYTDVIVCSIAGLRRLADWLAGGDYDGDKGIVFYDPDLVRHFRNADGGYSIEPKEVVDSFSQHKESVADTMLYFEGEPSVTKMRKYQDYLLGAIQDTTIVGTYSSFHDYAIYTLGYQHPETIRLNYMFCALLDRFKNGRILLPEAENKDRLFYQKRPPAWKESKEDRDRFNKSGDNKAYPKRRNGLGKFIMDDINSQAKEEGDRQLHAIEEKFKQEGRAIADPHLTGPWEEEQKNLDRARMKGIDITQWQAELDAIESHVKELHRIYGQRKSEVVAASNKSNFTSLPIESRQDVLRSCARDFAAGPPDDKIFIKNKRDIALLRASYAYLYDSQQPGGRGWSRFPWDVCTRDLNDIKARALGWTKTCTQDFYMRFALKYPSARRR